MRGRRLAVVVLVLLGASCRRKDPGALRVTEVPATPRGLPAAPDPADNPTTPAKVTLGRALFYDPRLSSTDFMTCSDCHRDDHMWAGSEPKSANAMGKRTRRKAPTVVNAAYASIYAWDGRAATLEDVIAIGWGQLGMTDQEAIAKKLDAIPAYHALFEEAFAGPATGLRIRQALGAFLRALKSGDSPYDRFVSGDRSAMSDVAQRGLATFEKLQCGRCHAPPLFTDWKFHDVGIGSGATGEAVDLGRGGHTKLKEDEGRFRTPSLRNVASVGPWFHDGSAATLDDAIRTMASGGVPHPGLDPLLQPYVPTQAELAELRAFLEALTGTPTMTAPTLLPDGKKRG